MRWVAGILPGRRGAEDIRPHGRRPGGTGKQDNLLRPGKRGRNSRHKSLIDSAGRHIDEALSTLENGLPADLIAIDILDAWHALGEITGENADEDIVDRIFEKFCLGK